MTPQQFFKRVRDPFPLARLGSGRIWKPNLRIWEEDRVWHTSCCSFGGEGATISAAIQSVFDHIEQVRMGYGEGP